MGTITLRLDKFATKASIPMSWIEDRVGFRDEWDLCVKSRRRDTTNLYHQLLPNLDYWVEMLTDPSSNRSIDYFAFLGSLPYEDNIVVLTEWVEAHREELHNILFSAYLSLVRRPPFKKWTCSRWQWFFIIGRYMRFALVQHVDKWYNHTRRWEHISLYDCLEIPGIPEPEFADSLLELHYRINKLPPFQYYLVSLYLLEYSRTDFEALTGTTSSFLYFWRTVNDYLKTTDHGKRKDYRSGSTSPEANSYWPADN